MSVSPTRKYSAKGELSPLPSVAAATSSTSEAFRVSESLQVPIGASRMASQPSSSSSATAAAASSGENSVLPQKPGQGIPPPSIGPAIAAVRSNFNRHHASFSSRELARSSITVSNQTYQTLERMSEEPKSLTWLSKMAKGKRKESKVGSKSRGGVWDEGSFSALLETAIVGDTYSFEYMETMNGIMEGQSGASQPNSVLQNQGPADWAEALSGPSFSHSLLYPQIAVTPPPSHNHLHNTSPSTVHHPQQAHRLSSSDGLCPPPSGLGDSTSSWRSSTSSMSSVERSARALMEGYASPYNFYEVLESSQAGPSTAGPSSTTPSPASPYTSAPPHMPPKEAAARPSKTGKGPKKRVLSATSLLGSASNLFSSSVHCVKVAGAGAAKFVNKKVRIGSNPPDEEHPSSSSSPSAGVTPRKKKRVGCPVPECPKTYDRPYQCRLHVLQKHGSLPRVQCEYIQAQLLNESTITWMHMEDPRLESGAYIALLRCPDLLEWASLKRHMEGHGNPPKFVCLECGDKTYSRADKFREHNKKKHPDAVPVLTGKPRAPRGRTYTKAEIEQDEPQANASAEEMSLQLDDINSKKGKKKKVSNLIPNMLQALGKIGKKKTGPKEKSAPEPVSSAPTSPAVKGRLSAVATGSVSHPVPSAAHPTPAHLTPAPVQGPTLLYASPSVASVHAHGPPASSPVLEAPVVMSSTMPLKVPDLGWNGGQLSSQTMNYPPMAAMAQFQENVLTPGTSLGPWSPEQSELQSRKDEFILWEAQKILQRKAYDQQQQQLQQLQVALQLQMALKQQHEHEQQNREFAFQQQYSLPWQQDQIVVQHQQHHQPQFHWQQQQYGALGVSFQAPHQLSAQPPPNQLNQGSMQPPPNQFDQRLMQPLPFLPTNSYQAFSSNAHFAPSLSGYPYGREPMASFTATAGPTPDLISGETDNSDLTSFSMSMDNFNP